MRATAPSVFGPRGLRGTLADLAEYTDASEPSVPQIRHEGTWYAHASVGTCMCGTIITSRLRRRQEEEDARHAKNEAFAPGAREYKASLPASTVTGWCARNPRTMCGSPSAIVLRSRQSRTGSIPMVVQPGRSLRPPPKMGRPHVVRFPPDNKTTPPGRHGARLVGWAACRGPGGDGNTTRIAEIRPAAACARLTARRRRATPDAWPPQHACASRYYGQMG